MRSTLLSANLVSATLATATLATVAFSSAAAAQEVALSFGASVTSEYVSYGQRQSLGPAIQLSVEAEVNGFYANLWASTVSGALFPGNTFEYDVAAGYRNTVGAFSYDVGYVHYFYNGTGASNGEIYLGLGYDVTEQINLGAGFRYDPVSTVTNSSINATFTPMEKLSFGATYGSISGAAGSTYYNVTGSYQVRENVSATLGYHKNSLQDGLVVGSLDFAFSLR